MTLGNNSSTIIIDVFMIKFIKADDSKINDIIDLAHKSWFQTYEKINSKEQNEYMFNIWYSFDGLLNQMKKGEIFWIMKKSEENIGFSSISAFNSQTFKLNKIYLLPNQQGMGLGKLLINHVEQYALANGANEIILNVNRNNIAIKFYESCNYNILKEENIPFGSYWMNDFVMQKTL